MNKIKSKLVFFAIVLFSLSPLISQGASFWEVQGHTAFTSKQIGSKYATFQIDWDPSSKCRPTVGTIIMTKKALGTYKKSQKSSEDMEVRIGNLNWNGPTILAGYQNGVEAMFYAPADLISAIKSHDSGNVEVQLFKSQGFGSFSLEGASKAIDAAKKACQ